MNETMNSLIFLFTDGSVHTQSGIGYGAYLITDDLSVPLDDLKGYVVVKRFEGTSSTKLELQTVLWALGEVSSKKAQVVIYTDSQNIVGLPGRREQLEQSAYRSKNNRLLNNHDLYQDFFHITDSLNCKIIKVIGHQKSSQKTDIEKIFTLVDKASRKALRGATQGIYETELDLTTIPVIFK